MVLLFWCCSCRSTTGLVPSGAGRGVEACGWWQAGVSTRCWGYEETIVVFSCLVAPSGVRSAVGGAGIGWVCVV